MTAERGRRRPPEFGEVKRTWFDELSGCRVTSALSVHSTPRFYEPHRSSGAGRRPCLQVMLVVSSFTAPSGVTRTPSSLSLGKPIFSGRHPGSAGDAHA